MTAGRASLEGVANVLPHRPGDPLVEVHGDPAFHSRPLIVSGYVWPEIRFQLPVDESSVLLITAPGAMGKSAAAHALASKIQAPLVDVAMLKVGSDTLTGLLSHVLGFSAAANYVVSMQRGESSLVLDSLDEAQLRVGRDNFMAFMKDISNLLEGAVGKRQLIMFGRADAMDNAHVALLDLGMSPVRAEITPLSYESATTLVDSHLDEYEEDGVRYVVHRTNPIPFGIWRDSAFDSLARALGSEGVSHEDYWNEVEDFLGYPPVLFALARHLAVPNPQQQTPSIASDRATRGDLLRQIVESILDRETEKVWNLLSPELGFDSGSPPLPHVFDREEQALRLVEFTSQTHLRISSPASLDPQQREIYDSQIGSFLPDHPFIRDRALANTVFSDYVRSIVSVSPLQKLHGVSRAELIRACPTLGPFFVHFVHSITSVTSNDGETGTGRVDDQLVDDLLRSFFSGVTNRGTFAYTNFDGASTLFLMEEIDIEQEDRKSVSKVNRRAFSEVLEFEISEPGVLEVTAPLYHGAIYTSGGVVVNPADSGEIRLGPSLTIATNELQIIGSQVVAISGLTTLPKGVYIRALASPAHEEKLRVVAHGEGAIRVDWPNPAYQWMPYREVAKIGAEKRGRENLRWQILFGTRRILLAFKKSVSDVPSAFSEYLDRDIIHGNEVFQAVFEGLNNLGTIARDGNVYHLNLAKLGQYGITWGGLRSSDIEGTLSSLYEDLARTESLALLLSRSE